MRNMLGFLFKKRIIRRRIHNKGARSEYLIHKETARKLVHEKLQHWNQFYNLDYKKVFIKNTKTKWGSCSSRGNLNFSYKIVFLDPELQDYLIVHELCHLAEMNHSKNFWDLVKQQIPNAVALHKKLRYTHTYGKTSKSRY
jgi:predicted metal-dependent hydrolase